MSDCFPRKSSLQKDQEKEIARLIMRSALDYLKTLLEYQGATAIANVNLDKE